VFKTNIWSFYFLKLNCIVFLFVIWWAHRDYDELWEIFPDEVNDIGKLWLDTGLVDESGQEKLAFETWKRVLLINKND